MGEFAARATEFWWLAAAGLAVLVGTLLVIPIVVIRMPADHFMPERRPPPARVRHSLGSAVLQIAKNLLGATLVLLGIALSLPFIPGQGILTILIGISLLDFPGKRALELKLVRSRPVRAALDWIRARAGRPPLMLPKAEGRKKR